MTKEDVMTKPEIDKTPEAEIDKFSVQKEAQEQKMGNAAQPHNPNKAPRTNEPNAGGANREKGHKG